MKNPESSMLAEVHTSDIIKAVSWLGANIAQKCSTWTEMRYSRVTRMPCCTRTAAEGRRPAMPYTTKSQTREQMTWKGRVAVTWGDKEGGERRGLGVMLVGWNVCESDL